MERIGESESRYDKKIDFRHVTLSFDESDEISDYLRQVEPGVILAQGRLVEPLRHNFMQTTIGDDRDTTSISAMIECHVDGATLFDSDWQDDIFNKLEGYYENLGDYNTFSLRHEPDALYVHQRYQRHALRIKASCEPDSCSIYIAPVNTKYIEIAQGSTVNQEDARVDPPDYALLYDVGHTWAKVQSLVFSDYAPGWSDNDYERIHIGVPHDWTEEADEENTLFIPTIVKEFFDSDSQIEPEDKAFDPSELVNYMTNIEAEFDTIGGQFEVKERLKEIGLAFIDPEGAAMFDVSAPSFILQGDPGTGKTTLVEAFAAATDADLLYVKMPDIQSVHISETAAKINQKFDEAKQADGRTILFFDEIDTLISEDNHQEFQNATKILGQLVEEVAKYYPNIIVIGCMNADSSTIVQSIIRSGRFELIAVEPPSSYEELRDTWFALMHQGQALFDDTPDESTIFYDGSIDYIELAKNSSDFTGADIAKILEDVRRKKLHTYRTTGAKSLISHSEIMQQITTFKNNRPEID